MQSWGAMLARPHSWVLWMALGAAALSGCGNGQASQCPTAAKAAVEVPIDVEPGVYEVAVEMEGAHASAWWSTRVQAGELVREARVMVGADRWLRLTTSGTIRVTECWAGGTAAGGCAELGPPRSGTLVLRRDGTEVMRLALTRPVRETLTDASCPTVHVPRT